MAYVCLCPMNPSIEKNPVLTATEYSIIQEYAIGEFVYISLTQEKNFWASGLLLQQALSIKGNRVVPITVSKNFPLKFFHARKVAFSKNISVCETTCLLYNQNLHFKVHQKTRNLVFQEQTVIFILEYCHHILGYMKTVYFMFLFIPMNLILW